jgi:hypothetical protein
MKPNLQQLKIKDAGDKVKKRVTNKTQINEQ